MHGVTTPRFLAPLSDVLGRVLIDKTGFNGIFDGRLAVTPDEAIADSIVGGRSGQPAPATDSVTPSIFTVIGPGAASTPAPRRRS